MNFDNSFQKLPTHLFENVVPTPLQSPKLALWNSSLAQELGLKKNPEICAWLNGEIRLPGDQQISTRYAGHQFGVWAGQLGDGRAISLGEILTATGRHEIQTKGSGLTPFSRMGDGKAVIRSSVREFFGSEAMHGLGIPTSRALALFTGTDPVERETIERSALLARVFPSNLRFGHFEYCFHYEKKSELQSLIDYTRQEFFPGLSLSEMLETITLRTADLLAQWMSVGFCHGVMNTDNMSILGITIDYGPFAFLDDFAWHHICNHSDHKGRYAFDRQPPIALWNLQCLAQCFSDFLKVPDLEKILGLFPARFQDQWNLRMKEKLGLNAFDLELTKELFEILHKDKIDYTYFFRQLCHYETNAEIFSPLDPSAPLKLWLRKWSEKVDRSNKSKQLKQNPKYVLRNWIANEIIREIEADKFQNLENWLHLFQHPFDEHPDFHAYSLPPKEAQKHLILSCSS